MKITFHRIVALSALALLPYGLTAAPAFPDTISFTQPNGSVIKGQLHGDEFFNYTTDDEGYVMVKNHDGFYEYAHPDSAGICPSGVRVDAPQLRSTASFKTRLTKGLTPAQQTQGRKQAEANRAKQAENMQGLHPAPTIIRDNNGLRATKHDGDLHFIIILVGFTDKAFVTSQQEFYNLHNQANLNGIGCTRDFYMQSSWNQFRPTFDVWGPVTVDMTSREARDNTGEMIKRACRLVDGLGANFADYDHDNDGTVDNVYCIFAGYDRAQGGGDDCIWSHASGVGGLQIDGKWIGGYGCSSELKGNSGTNHVNIGTFTHEFGHVIGLPDHYDTDGDNNGNGQSPGGWSTMAGGCYNNDSKSPPRFTAHDREQLGWCTIPTIQAGNNTVHYIQDSKDTPALRIPTNNDFEYFVLEFRKKEAFDSSLPASGMLIWHVDHSANTTNFQSGDNWSVRTYASLWNNNSVNNIEGHPCFDLVEGNGPNVNRGDVSMNANRMWPNGGSTQYNVQAWDNSIVSQLTNITNVNNNYATVNCNNNGGSGVISCITANNPAATFYQDSEYGGQAIGLPKGSYTMAQMARYCLPDHWISSLRVNNGYAVIAYDQDNFQGNSVAYTANTNFVGGNWNDKIVSLKVIDNQIDGCGLVTFYADCNRGGTSVSLPLGTYTTTELQLYGIGNDNLSSLEAPEGIEVTLFNNNNCQGDSLVCTGYVACLAGDLNFNDKASSIRIAAKGKSGLNGLYQIKGRNSGLYWEIFQSGRGNATAIVQTEKRRCDAQFFRLEEIGNTGTYHIYSHYTGLVADINGGNNACDNRRALEQYPLVVGNNNQIFAALDKGNGYYQLVAANSGKVIEVPDNSLADGAALKIWSNNAQTCSHWALEPVSLGFPTDLTDNGGWLTASHEGFTNEEFDNAVDNNSENKFCTRITVGQEVWLRYVSTKNARLTSYTIASANDAPDRDPKNWVLEGSNNGVNWTTLDTQTDQVFNNRFEPKSYAVYTDQSFGIIRLRIQGLRNASSDIFQISEWQLFGNENGTFTMVDEGLADGQSVYIHPNPATDWITVEGTTEGALIEIFDMTGRKCGQQQADAQRTVLSVSALQSGNYLVRIGATVLKLVK